MLDHFKQWFARPFSADMSAGQWFLFIGLLVIISASWRLIFMHLKAGD